MNEVTYRDLMNWMVSAFTITSPEWYRKRFQQLSDEDAGKVIKSIVLTLLGRSDEIDIDSLSETGKAAYCCGLTWMQDIKECLDIMGDDYE